jgi:glycogen operon protein
VVDTAGAGADSTPVKAGHTISVAAKALVVLRAFTSPVVEPDHSVAASLASLAGAVTPSAAAPSRRS